MSRPTRTRPRHDRSFTPRVAGLRGLERLERRDLLAAFTPGNLVIYRVGAGDTNLVNTGNPVFLDEYTTAGVLVQSIALPTADSGANKPLIASGVASSEGELALSPDGHYLAFAGYAATPGGSTSLNSTTAAAVPRTVGIVDASGAVNTATALTDFASQNNPRAAVTTDGTNIWVGGGAGGVRYATAGGTTSTQLSTTVSNIRVVNIFDGQLYNSDSSGSAIRLGVVGTGLPTTSGQTITNLPGFPTSGSPYAFYFAHLNAGVAGLNTLYVAEDTASAGVIQKYELVGGSWTAAGTITAAAVRGLTGTTDGTSVTLYATTGGSTAVGGGTLYTFTDTTGTGSVSGAATTLASASTNQAFRGVSFVPVPVPSPVTTMGAVTTNGATGLTFNYTITGAPATTLPVSVYRTAGTTVQAGDTLLATVTITGAADLTVGSHAVTVTIGTGVGEVPLPGVGSPDLNTDYRILAVSNDGTAGASTSPLVGVYHAPGGDVLAQGGEAADSAALDPGVVKLTFNGTAYTYTAADVTRVRLRLHGGDDTVYAGSGVPAPIYAWAAEGNDTLTAGGTNLGFDGGTGSNRATVTAPAGATSGSLTPTTGYLNGAGFSLGFVNVTNANLNGNAASVAYLTGSSVADTFTTTANGSKLSDTAGTTFTLRANGFGRVHAYEAGGDNTANLLAGAGDTVLGTSAYSYVLRPGGAGEEYVSGFKTVNVASAPSVEVNLYGTNGDETLTTTPTTAAFGDTAGTAFAIKLTGGYAHLYAQSGGGNDAAGFTGSSGADTFTGTPDVSWLTGPGYAAYAYGFKTVGVTAGTGGAGSMALLYGSTGADTLTTSPTAAALHDTAGTKYSFSAGGFGTVYALGQGGADVATLNGSSGVDTFSGSPGNSRLSGAGYLDVVYNFSSVTAQAGSGGAGSTAYLFGSTGADELTTSPSNAALHDAGGVAYSLTSKGFGASHAYGQGGADTATMNAGAGDTFLATPTYAYMLRASGSGQEYASGFTTIHGVAAPGLGAIARLSDGSFPGQFVGGGDLGTLTDGSATPSYTLTISGGGFSSLTLDGRGSGSNRKRVTPPTSYTLTVLGTWDDN